MPPFLLTDTQTNPRENKTSLAEIIGSLSSTSDTNNKSCACAVLAKRQRRSVLEVATVEVRAILVVVGIERQTYINPVFYRFLGKDVKYLFISIA